MNKYIFLIILFILTGCGQSNKSGSNVTDGDSTEGGILYVNLENVHKQEGVVSLSTVASDIQYIPLETNDNSLINRISNIIKWGDNFLINGYTYLLLFDETGRFIRKISQQGGGPADFRYVNHIITDPSTGMLYLFTFHKIIKFDKSGQYIDNYPMEIQQHAQGRLTPDNTFLMYIGNQVRTFDDTTKVNSLVEMDTFGKVVRYYENRTPRYLSNIRGSSQFSRAPLYVYDNLLRFKEVGNDTLYTIQNGDYIPYVILDLGDMKMNENPDGSHIQSPAESKAFMAELAKKLLIDNIFESDDHFIISLSWGGIRSISILYV